MFSLRNWSIVFAVVWCLAGLFYDGIGNDIGAEMALLEAEKLNVANAEASAITDTGDEKENQKEASGDHGNENAVAAAEAPKRKIFFVQLLQAMYLCIMALYCCYTYIELCFNPSNAVATFIQSTGKQRFLKKHLNRVMLVFIG